MEKVFWKKNQGSIRIKCISGSPLMCFYCRCELGVACGIRTCQVRQKECHRTTAADINMHSYARGSMKWQGVRFTAAWLSSLQKQSAPFMINETKISLLLFQPENVLPFLALARSTVHVAWTRRDSASTCSTISSAYRPNPVCCPNCVPVGVSCNLLALKCVQLSSKTADGRNYWESAADHCHRSDS